MKTKRLFSKPIRNLCVLVSVMTLAMTFLVENPTRIVQAEGNANDVSQTVIGNDIPVHDPSIIKVGDTYYVFGTHGAAAKSTDLTNWENIVVNNEVDNHTLFGDIRDALEEVFKWSGNPEKSNMDEIGLWAPDVYYNDKFVNEDGTIGAFLMYFSISTGQDEPGVEHYRSLIGLASSKDVEGPYVFEDVVVYSGFLNNEGKSNYKNTDFNEVFPGATPRLGYFNKDRFNHDNFPNAIDPTIVEGKDGNLHMSYGSWHGGIWVLDLDPATGLPVRPTDYAGGKAPNMDDSYFGTRISGGFKTSGEGSYVEYHEASEYYHLYVTYGGLTQAENYNVRFFRSKNINGPYVDSQGNNPKFDRKTGNEKYGDRILGSFEFLENQVIDDNGRFYSYRVPGHNSVLYGDDGNDYIVFHTRFKDKGEGHAVRVHQLLFDKDGWPLVAPSRYEGESIQKDAKLAGQYALVNQEKDNANASKLSKTMILNDDKTISGSLLGKWEVNGELVKLTIGEDVYEGYALNQGTSLTDYKTDITLTLRGVSDSVKGQSLFAVRLSQLSSEEVMEAARSSLDIDNKNNVLRDIDLVTKYKGVDVTWESDSPEVINTSGKVTRSDDNQIVKLKASLRYETFESTKEFDVTVIGLNQKTVYRYEFDGTIEETNTGLKGSQTTGNRLHLDGGTENYTEGIVKKSDGELGTAFKFDGETGIALPNDIINSDVYSVSMWLNPESIRHFTSLFFGQIEDGQWVSFVPHTGHGDMKDNALLWTSEPWYMADTKTKLPLDEWSHFAFTNDKGVLKIYINGLEVFSGEGFPDLLSRTAGNRFGLGVNSFDPAFEGSVDDLMIYPDSALNANEVAAYFNDVMGIQSPEDIANGIFKTIKIPSETRRDIELLSSVAGVDVTWETSNSSVITVDGKVNQPAIGQQDVLVRLTASFTIEGEVFTQEFTVRVKAKLATVKSTEYNFNKTLESNNEGQAGTLVGGKIQEPGGTLNYAPGIIGDGVYLDGSTGIVLPKNLITSDKYSISLWMNPENVAVYTTAFFGQGEPDSWISVVPKSGNPDLNNSAMVWSGSVNYYDGPVNRPMPLNAWTHMTVDVDGANIKVYFNGVLAHEGSHFPDVFKNHHDNTFAVGVNHWDVPFKGTIDELKILPNDNMGAQAVKSYYESVMLSRTPEAIANEILDLLKVPAETQRDISLETIVNETRVTWTSSHTNVITTGGKVTPPAIGKNDVTVQLTASVTIEGEVFTKVFNVLVKAKKAEVETTEFSFNKTLESNVKGKSGSLVGNQINIPGGTLNYAPGVVGEGVYLDGSTGILLPKNLITSDKYSISLWMNPEDVAGYTTAFFGQGEPDSWISVVPKSGNPNLNNSAMVWSGSVNYYDGPVNRPMPLNAWTHMTVDVDGANIKVYFNGVLAHEGTNFPDVFKNHHDNTFALGVNHWDVPFKGTIDELKILPNDNMGAKAVKAYYDSIMSTRTPEEIANDLLNSLIVPSETESDLNLKTSIDNIPVTWTSSNSSVISIGGKVTQPAIGQKDVSVRLKASVTVQGEVFTKEFVVLVKAKKAVAKGIEFNFDKTLDSNIKGQSGSLVGNFINVPGGTLNYAPGVVGEGVYLDGSTGVLLPKNLITSKKYSISLWMNPEAVEGYTTAFFGQGEPDSWISVVPKSGNPDLNNSAMVWAGSANYYDGPVNRPMPLNAWTHMTVDVDGANVKVYFNGVLAHEGTQFPDVFKNHKDNTFAVGVNHWDVPFKGTIDELKILPNDNMGAKAVKAYYDSIMSTRTPEEIANDLLNSLIIPSETESDLNLKTSIDNTPVTWTSSNSSVISIGGKVTQPAIGQKDVSVRLKASVTVQGKVFTKEFVVLVKAKKAVAKGTEFSFDKTLDSNIKGQSGSLVGNFINAPGGTLKYATGMVGDGVYLDGSTGILLPRNLITSNKYSISMWLNPQELSGFTTAFFGEGAPMSWISVVPQAGNPDFKGSAMIWSGEQWYDGVLNKQMPINSWSHITVDVNHGKIAVYFNGVLAHTGDSFPDVFGNHNDNVFALGVNFWDTPFKGTIDELKILPNDNVGAQGAKAYYDSIMATLSPEKVLQQYLDSLVFGVDGVVTENLVLPLQTPDKQSMTWTTSHSKWLSNKGVVTRPTAAQGDQKVRLSVSVTVDGKVVVKHYDLIIKALPIVVDKVTYTFDGHLEEVSKNGLLTGTTTGRFIDTVGGKAQYREGKVGEGVYLDGSSGIRLPDNLITGNTYSVSMWMKPEVMSGFSTTFFGLKNADSWLSFTPKGVADQAVLWSGTQWYDGLTGDQFSENQWRHVAFTVNNGNVKVYVDGVEKHSGTNFPNIFSTDGDQIFGLGVNFWDAPFQGVIDDLTIETKRVMSNQEIYKYYDATVGSDRFVRNVDRSIKYDFEGNVGSARVTGDRLNNSGGSVSYQEGVLGEAVYLNGASGLSLPDNFLTSDTYSFQMWVKPESITPFTSMFFGGTSASSWVNLPASGVDGKTMFWSGEQWYDALTPDTIPANRWSHMAVSVSKGNVSVYIDGEVKFEGTGFPDIFNSKNSFAGIGVNFWDAPFKGLIDEFEIDNNIARSAKSIQTYYETTKPEQAEFERNQEKNHHFKFEDDLKDDLDETLEGNVIGHQIGVEGGNLAFVEGKDGKAVYLDGESGILLPEELITSESYSVSLWVNPEAITAHSTTFFGSQTEASWFSVVPQSGEFTGGNSMVWSGTDWFDGNLGKQIGLDEWSHIAFSVEGGVLNAYLNGEKVFTGEDFPDIFTQEGSVFALGVNYWDIPFVGSIDELMVFDSRVLSDDEVKSIAGGNFDINETEKESNKDPKVEAKTSKVPVITYIGGGAVGVGAIAYLIKRYLDAKKVA